MRWIRYSVFFIFCSIQVWAQNSNLSEKLKSLREELIRTETRISQIEERIQAWAHPNKNETYLMAGVVGVGTFITSYMIIRDVPDMFKNSTPSPTPKTCRDDLISTLSRRPQYLSAGLSLMIASLFTYGEISRMGPEIIQGVNNVDISRYEIRIQHPLFLKNIFADKGKTEFLSDLGYLDHLKNMLDEELTLQFKAQQAGHIRASEFEDLSVELVYQQAAVSIIKHQITKIESLIKR